MFPAPVLIPGSGFSLMWMIIATQRLHSVLPYGSAHTSRHGKTFSQAGGRGPIRIVLLRPSPFTQAYTDASSQERI